MDMMFNTEVIVKDMKGGKEDMTETKQFRLGYVCGDYGLIDNDEWIDLHSMSENSEKNVKLCINKMNELADENEQLKQYKQSVNDVLRSWSQKNLTAKQLQVVLAIMEELNVR